MNKNYIKIVLLGDGRVGKTSILNRYINNTFNDKEEMTVNCSYFQKDIEFNGIKYTFCLWDTAGQEKFNALTPIYYRDAKGAILVYDVSIKETFSKVKKWHDELKTFNKDTVIAVAGNKFDLGNVDIDKELVTEYTENNGCQHIYTSAKTGEGLDEIFHQVAKEIVDGLDSSSNPYGGSSNKKKGLKITKSNDNNKDKKGGCC